MRTITPRIELIWLSETAPASGWPLGATSRTAPTPWALARVLQNRLAATDADAFLFWDPSIGTPEAAAVTRVLANCGDIWHAGLLLGMNGKPGLIDFVAPAWPFNRDPDPCSEAISWRLSLRACVVRVHVLCTLGGPDPRFDSLDLAGLELGHRYIRHGAIPRHAPTLIGPLGSPRADTFGFSDELRFVALGYGKSWARWAAGRALLSGYVPIRTAAECLRELTCLPAPGKREPVPPRSAGIRASRHQIRVSVIIPTLDRYPYLRRLLDQLRTQTAPAYEILVVDQTPAGRLRRSIAAEFVDLPLRVMVRDKPGQCSARNAAILAAQGDCVLFLDDDDEVPPGLIASHLRCLEDTGADGCCGVADEVGAGALPPEFTYFRASDVLPGNNAMVRRTALAKSGLFDLAYDKGSLADGDLGIRLLLSGAVLVLNPAVRVLHHHAPRGGLRVHRARVVTYAISRNSLFARRLPSASEVYYLKRYFTPRQVAESLWLSAFGTFAARGGTLRKLARAVIAALLLPSTWLRIRRARQGAEVLAKNYPAVPNLPGIVSERPKERSRQLDEVVPAVSA